MTAVVVVSLRSVLASAVMADPVLRVRDLDLAISSRFRLHGVSLSIAPGDSLALLGPNGAGKTSTLECVLGLRRTPLGVVELCGAPPTPATLAACAGVALADVGFPARAPVSRVVAALAGLRGVPADEVLSNAGLGARASAAVGSLSEGERQRLRLALAFAGAPRVLILDEPSTALDLAATEWLWSSVAALREHGAAVLLTTHRLEEADRHAGQIVLLANGRPLARGTPRELRRRAGLGRRVAASLSHPLDVASLAPFDAAVLQAPPPRFEALATDTDGLARVLLELGARDLEITPVALEDAIGTLLAEGLR